MTHEIWIDTEAMHGIPDTVIDLFSEKIEEILGPLNKRPCPCDTCPLNASCASLATECSAFRNWTSKGDFLDGQVGKHVRAMS
jgi:hypothetical protein